MHDLKPHALSDKPTAITHMDDKMLLSVYKEALEAEVCKDFIMLIQNELTNRKIRF